MAKHTQTSNNEFERDYNAAASDYNQMGPLWAEMVFPDDYEAMKALYGRRSRDDDKNYNQNDNEVAVKSRWR